MGVLAHEHQVALDGGGHASQTDLWALLSAPIGVTSVAVEAKAGESFDMSTHEWLASASPAKRGRLSGKPARLRQLCTVLGISESEACGCRYQLLHRSVAAVLEAKRFRLGTALFLVHAFGDNRSSLDDYRHWARQLGVDATENGIHDAGIRDGVSLWIAWLGVPPASDSTVRAAVE